jgi:hypothetical protein
MLDSIRNHIIEANEAASLRKLSASDSIVAKQDVAAGYVLSAPHHKFFNTSQSVLAHVLEMQGHINRLSNDSNVESDVNQAELSRKTQRSLRKMIMTLLTEKAKEKGGFIVEGQEDIAKLSSLSVAHTAYHIALELWENTPLDEVKEDAKAQRAGLNQMLQEWEDMTPSRGRD